MPTSGDVVDLDLGTPEGREAGFRHPAVVVTAQRILDANPAVVHVVPLTSTLRGFHSEVTVEPDAGNGLRSVSAAQCQHVRAISPRRILTVRGNVGVSTSRDSFVHVALSPDIRIQRDMNEGFEGQVARGRPAAA